MLKQRLLNGLVVAWSIFTGGVVTAMYSVIGLNPRVNALGKLLVATLCGSLGLHVAATVVHRKLWQETRDRKRHEGLPGIEEATLRWRRIRNWCLVVVWLSFVLIVVTGKGLLEALNVQR